MFRDAVVLLPGIISAECVQNRIPRKGLTKAATCIEQVLEFSDRKEGTGAPMALLDPSLRSSYIKLQEYCQEHCLDTLDDLQAFVRANPSRKNHGPLSKLLNDFHREFRSFGYEERTGVTKRSEERWTLFADIATVLADWIGLVLAMPKPLSMPLSKKMVYQLRTFAKQYPGRVPPLLLSTIAIQIEFVLPTKRTPSQDEVKRAIGREPEMMATSPSASSEYVDLSQRGFALWWLLLLGVHLVTCGYNAAYALFYWELQFTYLNQCLEYSGIGMPPKNHHVISVAHALMAALHGISVLLMVGSSLWLRHLAFSPWTQLKSSISTVSRGSTRLKKEATVNDGVILAPSSTKAAVVEVFRKFWDRRGLLGVNGANFHAILIARELVETALQTVQAYRMSWYLPRMLLNRFYLSLLVVNCWSSVLIYSLMFKHNEAHRRFACLLCDCVLDLISCMGVPLIVVLSYVGEYNPKITGFDMEKWYDDYWAARVLNEFQMVVVVSWSDLASRTIFSFGLLLTTNSIKELLRQVPSGGNRIAHCAATNLESRAKNGNMDAVGPTQSDITLTSQPLKPRAVVKHGGSYSGTGLRSRHGRKLLYAVHLLFGAWGFFVLGLHIQASVQPEAPQCLLQVRPWAVSQPSCYLVGLDCHVLEISGKHDEVEAKWSEIDRSTVVIMLIRHCPTLEIPGMFNDFHQLRGIKVYNSTINTWGTSAALTNTNHPKCVSLFVIRTNMADGLLPAGFQSSDFPLGLYDIEFCITNLRELPDDLDSKWLVGTMIYIEFSQLTTVSPTLARLQPYYLALTGNPITELPPEIFEVADMLYLGVGSTMISELPRNVTDLSPLLSFIYITDTNVSFFWPWIDPLVERKLEMPRPLLMGGSTYCSELGKITSGEAEAFSVLPSPEYSVLLTDGSEGNRGVILHTVNCETSYAATFYPLVAEDIINTIE